MGQGTAIGTVLRGDISKLRRCRKTLRRGRKGYQRLIPLDICCHFSEAFPPGASGPERVLLYGISVARASPSGADRRDREGQVLEEEQVRREPAPQFPLEGVYRPGTDGAPVIGSKMAALKFR